MPKISRKTSDVEERKPFGVYDGEEPPRGNYPGIVKIVQYKTPDGKVPHLNVLVELYSEGGWKEAYNGYPCWVPIYLNEKEANKQKEQAFYLAICGKADIDFVTDVAKPWPNVEKIGGKRPIDVAVRVDIQKEEYPVGSGIIRTKGDTIYAATAAQKSAARNLPAAKGDAAEPEPEETIEAEKPTRSLAAVPDPEPAAPAGDDDYHAMTLPNLRKFATENGVETAGKSKAKLIEALDEKFSEGGDETAEGGEDNAGAVKALSDDDFNAYLEDKGYDPGDFEGMTREESVKLLVEDGVVSPF